MTTRATSFRKGYREMVILLLGNPQFVMNLSGRFRDLSGHPPQSRHA